VGGSRLKYCSMTDVIVKTVRNEGFLGLYKASHTITHYGMRSPHCILRSTLI
jgi:hypothetical protein